MDWALVLSGGGARGIAHIGLLKALEELNFPKPSCIVGCSMGAIIGGLYSLGVSPSEMEYFFVSDFNVSDYVGAKQFNALPNISKILQLGSGLTNLITKLGADTGERLFRLLKKLSKNKSFSDCYIPFYCNAVDICTGKEKVFSEGIIAAAMRASSAYPGVFYPFKSENTYFVDGCILNNTPVWIARKEGFSNILAITLGTFQHQELKSFMNGFDIIMRCLDCATHHYELLPEDYPTAVLDIDTKTKPIDFSNTRNLVNIGYSAVMQNEKMLNNFFNSGLLGNFYRRKLEKKTKERFLL
ncbi:patatin-like phospholipase family protein [Treponema phagedenis]|uniref:patatin-like phospholipase family protein n=1 Tax=Treponema phagedenis TaxID=162 RepID=UPI0001F63D7D|nr:patatin-like phospholipase family protein [Treponema phagedenis]EFW38481.1 phospholipase, patatin family [Treponema phagedenis F0421]TYT79039.1 patatin-like phospholipase family protein [Treponema phagedenis]